MQQITSSCDYCQKKRDTRKCKGCHTFAYCDTVCQRQDWKSHKETCNLIQEFKSKGGDMDKAILMTAHGVSGIQSLKHKPLTSDTIDARDFDGPLFVSKQK
jgi:hypothetical protein